MNVNSDGNKSFQIDSIRENRVKWKWTNAKAEKKNVPIVNITIVLNCWVLIYNDSLHWDWNLYFCVLDGCNIVFYIHQPVFNMLRRWIFASFPVICASCSHKPSNNNKKLCTAHANDFDAFSHRSIWIEVETHFPGNRQRHFSFDIYV